MKKRTQNNPQKKSKRYNGTVNYEHEEMQLDPEIVSTTEMTGVVPAAPETYEEDAFEENYF